MNEIKLEHISKEYRTDAGRKTVFRDLGLSLPLGKITVVVGRSGCGKTTLLRLLGGQEMPESGTITTPEDFHSTMLFPEPYLITWTSVLNNIKLAAGVGVAPEEREALAWKLAALVQLSGSETLTPKQLSTGMKQRLALARALACQSQLLLMDEPFASLDFFTRTELQQVLLQVQAQMPRTIVFVTHELGEAILMADQIVVLHTDGTAACFAPSDLPAARSEDSPAFLQFKKQLMQACMQ